MIASPPTDLWGMVFHRQHLDPADLTRAIEDQVRSGDLDYRTCVLIRDSLKALRHYWGDERVKAWLNASSVRRQIEAASNRRWDDDRGFRSLMRRVMDVTKPETIRQYLRDLGQHVHHPLRVYVGGSAALILPGLLSRKTEDIDVVDEVPAELRSQYALLEELVQRYNLELTHFQRHYLALGWESRVHSQEPFGRLQVYLLDPYDVFLSKLFSVRTKDLDDLREVAPYLDKETLVRLFKESTEPMLASEELRRRAEHNWYILYGEPLPS